MYKKMTTLTHAEYCFNKTVRASLGWMNGFYVYNGKFYTKQQINALYPITLRLVNALDIKKSKGENSDKTKNFLKDQKVTLV
jgi:hypothetical protein